jgi:hypothetical protein
MTSDQIRDTLPTDLSGNSWLKEIAFQLALLNERQSIPEPIVSRPMPRKKVQ